MRGTRFYLLYYASATITPPQPFLHPRSGRNREDLINCIPVLKVHCMTHVKESAHVRTRFDSTILERAQGGARYREACAVMFTTVPGSLRVQNVT